MIGHFNKKTLTKEQWADTKYVASIIQEGDDWYAWYPDLGKGLFMADGATPTEAIANLEQRKIENFDLIMKSKYDIPFPTIF